MGLLVEKGAFEEEFKRVFEAEVRKRAKNLKEDIEDGFNSNGFNQDTSLGRSQGEIKVEVEMEENKIRLKVFGNAAALMDIFGTGSLMDTESNPLIDEYIGSDMWNPYRSKSDTTIKGRREGYYTDVFGNQQYSSGNLAGLDIEGIEFTSENGDYFVIKPIPPSHALDIGIRWFKQDSIQDIYRDTVRNMNLANCIKVTK